MTRRARRVFAICALMALPAACGGGGARSPVSRAEPRPKRPAATPTTPAPSTIGSTTTSVALPEIVDRGDDVEVARSLLLFGRWLEAEHPDRALVPRAFAWGGNLARSVGADVATLARTGRRIVEVDAAPLQLDVVSRLPNVVSFRVTERLDRRDLVDAHGRVLDHVGPATEHYVVVIHRFAPAEPWRLGTVDRIPPNIEVEL